MISGVNKLDSAAQLIPPLISAAYFIRSIYVCMSGPNSTDDSSHHYYDFPYFPTGDGGSYSYTISDNSATNPKPRRTAYVGASSDWAGRRRHSHRHHRRHHRGEYDAGEPVMSTVYSRRATVVDVPEEAPGAAAAAGKNVPAEPALVHENA